MRYPGLSALAAVLLFLPACSGGSGGGASGGSVGNAMYVLTCSLGCPSGAGGLEVHCTPINVAPNQEFVITFSLPVDPGSVSSETFSIIDTFSGSTPLGTRLVDPADPRKVIFRPAITFDSAGNPNFGFSSATSYSIVVKGTSQDADGPYIRSTGGKSNASRLACQMQTTSSPIDYVPGAPSVEVRVDLANTATPGNPNDIIANVAADGAVDVWRSSTVRFVFDDIMNPVTLANQVTHQSSYATIQVDVDGDLGTLDRVALEGNYVVAIDLANLRTTMTFTSNTGMPSSGDPTLDPSPDWEPRKVVVTFPSGIQDLAGHALSNAGSLAFTPEFVPIAAQTLPDDDGENFDDNAFEQADVSAGAWGNGRLTRGYGGGSGRLGSLIVHQGTAVVLDTDSQDFPLDPATFPSAENLRSLLDNELPGVDYDPADPGTWPDITVTDGIFEFSSLKVETGGILGFSGSKPARVLVRGPVVIEGNALIDISGASAGTQLSDAAQGGAGALGGPNGGEGGDGADRYDNTGIASLIAVGAISNPGGDVNGEPGGGVGLIPGLGAAHGGQAHPILNLPSSNLAPASSAAVNALAWTFDDLHFPVFGGCMCLMSGAPGGGGTYSISGTQGVGATPMLTNEVSTTNLPVNTAPGSLIDIEPPDPQGAHFVRKLEADNNNLRGGAGGGGGGLSFFGTQTSVQIIGLACGGGNNTIPPGPAGQQGYQDNSACGGGGGGGAIQLVSGVALQVDGVIDATGGSGGSANAASTTDRARQATPGGGGSGGAVRLQAPFVVLGQVPGRIDIRGGTGGATDMNHLTGGANVLNALGGNGSPGLVRIEDTSHLLSRATEAPWILPFDPNDLHPQSNQPESEDFLSVGNWTLPRKRPESFTASTSCWMQPATSFFLLHFLADDLGNPDPALRYGWNMDVVYNSGAGEILIKYRGPDVNLPFPGGDFQSNLGNNLNHGLPTGQGSYFAVRFQGAKSLSNISGNPCDVDLGGLTPQIAAGSLTPWVQHPADLNSFTPRPDMVRYCVIFDTALVTPNSIPFFIKGVTNLKIRTRPD